jgi:hypothetical protein
MYTDNSGVFHFRGIVETVPVLWVAGELLNLPGKRFGICGKTKKIFKVTKNVMPTLIVTDIIINKLRCEEKERCLNTNCVLNQSTAKSLKISKKAFEELPIEKNRPELPKLLEELYAKNPKGGLVGRV